jgi:hypothetical protein
MDASEYQIKKSELLTYLRDIRLLEAKAALLGGDAYLSVSEANLLREAKKAIANQRDEVRSYIEDARQTIRDMILIYMYSIYYLTELRVKNNERFLFTTERERPEIDLQNKAIGRRIALAQKKIEEVEDEEYRLASDWADLEFDAET